MLMSSMTIALRLGGQGHAPREQRTAVVPATRVGAAAAPLALGRRGPSGPHCPGATPSAWGGVVNVAPVINTVRATLSHQAALAGADPAVAAAINQLVEALAPAMRLAAMELAEQAAAEVRAQLPNHTVDLVVVDGDPTLRVGENAGASARVEGEDFVSRLTLRLPPSLKE